MQMVAIRRPARELVSSYLEFIEEMRRHGERIWEGMIPQADEDPDAFVARLNWAEDNLGPTLVPTSTYWGVIGDGKVVGRIVLRHRLTEKLSQFGGHISYEVRPSSRRCGVAKGMLRQVLSTPKAKEIGRLLLTCAPANVASNKTIAASGGVLTRTAYVEEWQRDTNYYWIDLGKP